MKAAHFGQVNVATPPKECPWKRKKGRPWEEKVNAMARWRRNQYDLPSKVVSMETKEMTTLRRKAKWHGHWRPRQCSLLSNETSMETKETTTLGGKAKWCGHCQLS